MKTAVLFLHGSGGSGPELKYFLDTFRIPQLNSKTFSTLAQENNFDIITPSSVLRSYTPAGGEKMNVWYDRSANFIELGRKDREYITSVSDSVNQICRIIQEIEGRYDRIAVGGFSMGGGLALHFVRESVRSSSKICAVFSIGSFLVESSMVFQETIQTNLPLMMMHGISDSLIRAEWGQATAQQLQSKGAQSLEFKLYPRLDHELGSSQLADLMTWLTRVVESSSSSMKVAAASTQCDAIDNPSSSSSQFAADSALPYTIEKLSGTSMTESGSTTGGDQYCITFTVPVQYLDQVCARPVVCCGGQFELHPVSVTKGSATGVSSENVEVRVDAMTADPNYLASEIIQRLRLRVTGDSDANPCPIQ